MMGGADFGCTYWGECDEKDGMHLCSQGFLHVEIIDPDTLESLPIETGVTGELVYTAIARQASPLLRYRMGDIVTVNSTSCRCGRTGYKIKAHGRADDMLIIRGVNVFPAAIKDLVMQFIPRTTGLMQILVDLEGHSAWITINRPERLNAFRGRTIDELIWCFKTAWADSNVGVVTLTGAGDRAFCVGGDQKERDDEGKYGPTEFGLFEEEYLQRLMRDVPKPIIAAVNGYAIGGGHVLHVVCDLTIAADHAELGQAGPRVGSFDAGFGTAYLARTIGSKRAREV